MNDCIFCKIIRAEAKSWKIWENDYAYAFLDIHPVSRYHTLVIPKNHYENIFDIPESELREVIAGVKKVCKLYEEKLGIQNLQIVNSNGREGQQDVFHIHFHIVPRKKGDGQNIKWKTFPEWRREAKHGGAQMSDMELELQQLKKPRQSLWGICRDLGKAPSAENIDLMNHCCFLVKGFSALHLYSSMHA